MSIDSIFKQIEDEDGAKAVQEKQQKKYVLDAIEFAKNELSSGSICVLFGDMQPKDALELCDFYVMPKIAKYKTKLHIYRVLKNEGMVVDIDGVSIGILTGAVITSRNRKGSECVSDITRAEEFGMKIARVVAENIHASMNIDYKARPNRMLADPDIYIVKIDRYCVPGFFYRLEDAVQNGKQYNSHFDIYNIDDDWIATQGSIGGLYMINNKDNE